MNWQPIETAPLDGTDVLVWCEYAATEFVHIAWYRSAEDFHTNPSRGLDERIEDYVGWWTYVSSVTQVRLEGYQAPKAWAPYSAPGDQP